MKNLVETLRAICYTSEDLKNIKNLGDVFSEKEIEFMVEFKKIYELGLNQLEKFINKLHDEGSELDSYTIMYYVNNLLNGPLSNQTIQLSEGKNYFGLMPNNMGGIGNKTKSPANITVYQEVLYQYGCAIDTYNNLPEFVQETLRDSVEITEDLFRINLKSSSFIDNTLPTIDKKNNTERYSKEPTGEWVKTAHGTYMVKDTTFLLETEKASSQIFDKVKEYLGEENFRIYKDKKLYNPFLVETNESKSTNSIVEKEFQENDKKQIIFLDLMGDEFDYEDKRKYAMKLTREEKDEEFLLNTNKGQLGNKGKN